MASLPSIQKKESKPEPKWKPILREKIIEAADRGQRPVHLANRITKDPVARKKWRQRIRTMLRTDTELAQLIGAETNAELLLGLPAASRRMMERARKTGRAPEVKLAMEATGVHNPRVKHDHSGDVTIHLDIPRPAPVVNEAPRAIEGHAEEVD